MLRVHGRCDGLKSSGALLPPALPAFKEVEKSRFGRGKPFPFAGTLHSAEGIARIVLHRVDE
jgi:hypothetical protein